LTLKSSSLSWALLLPTKESGLPSLITFGIIYLWNIIWPRNSPLSCVKQVSLIIARCLRIVHGWLLIKNLRLKMKFIIHTQPFPIHVILLNNFRINIHPYIVFLLLLKTHIILWEVRQRIRLHHLRHWNLIILRVYRILLLLKYSLV